MERTKEAKAMGHELLQAAGVEIDGPNPWDIQIHDDRVFERTLRDRELGLAEAYQEGWWDADSVDQFLVKIQLADIQSTMKPGPGLLLLAAKAQLSNRQNQSRAGANARAHYDIGNDLYERMLDPRMIYSCAYWADCTDLDTAQEAKLDLICRKLQLESGMTLLDIGCGWGGLAEFAASKYGVQVTGITPAAEQATVAEARCIGLPVQITQTDYRNVQGTFDRVVSVGMMEHVGPKNLRTFFDVCRDRLAPDGIMLHHTIGSNQSKGRTDPWFDKYIFPGGVVPSLEQITGAALQHWAIEDVHNFGPDYDRTLMAWLDNIDRAWSDIPSYDEYFRRTWRYYLMASASSFRVRNLQLWQVVCRRSNRASESYTAVR
jgi:cyclopropane-fatty-acyl-phospholipid synthase